MRMMSKELLLKLAADYSVLAEDLKKLAGEEAPAESEKEEKVDVPFEVEEKKEPPKQEKKPEKKYTMAERPQRCVSFWSSTEQTAFPRSSRRTTPC